MVMCNKINSCPDLSIYPFEKNKIKKSISLSSVTIILKKCENKNENKNENKIKSYGNFLINNPNASKKERIIAIKKFLDSVY